MLSEVVLHAFFANSFAFAHVVFSVPFLLFSPLSRACFKISARLVGFGASADEVAAVGVSDCCGGEVFTAVSVRGQGAIARHYGHGLWLRLL
jgi:uncharacterized membrane protein